MAIQLQKTTSINIGVIVNNAIAAVKTVRAQDQSRKEAEFQKAVADGLSYEGQIEFRKKQLETESESGFGDPAYRTKLEESLATTKRLSRFYNYRTKYQEALGELNAGHTNAVEYERTLKNLFDETNDPDLRAEIQNNLTSAQTMVTQYKNTVLANQVKLAQYDGTEKTLNGAIKKIKQARALAAINGNEDEVAEYDLTIASLKSQVVQTKAENVVNDIAVSGMLGANNATSKLKTIGLQISESDTDTPVTINGKRFESEQQYWEITRNAYLSGNGSGVFGDYFSDLESQYKEKINGETARFGFVQPATIQKINSDLSTLRAQPEMAPYIDRIDSFRALTVADAVSTVAKTVIDRASYTGDFTQADTTLKGLGSTYQVDTTGYQLQLGTILNQQVNASISAGLGTPAEASLLPASEFSVPSVSTTVPGGDSTPPVPNPITGNPETPTSAPAPTNSTRPDYSVVSGDNLSSIASRNGMSLTQLLDLNPEYKANPNAVSVGAKIKVATPTPVTSTPVTPVPVASPVSNTPSTPSQTTPQVTMPQTATRNPKTNASSVDQQSLMSSARKELEKRVIKLRSAVEELERRKGQNSDNIKK